MAQVLQRVKTFFMEMTNNTDIAVGDNIIDLEKEVKKLKAQQTRDISKMEKEVENINIPLEDELVVKKVKINEKIAQEEASRKNIVNKEKDVQRGN